MNKKIQNEESVFQKYEKSDEKNSIQNEELPESIKLMFDSMKESRLTKE